MERRPPGASDGAAPQVLKPVLGTLSARIWFSYRIAELRSHTPIPRYHDPRAMQAHGLWTRDRKIEKSCSRLL